MTQAVADTLQRAKALIDTPETWCQRAFTFGAARCARMAIQDAHGDYQHAIEALSHVIGTWGLAGWQDAPERTHAEVMEAFSRAIAAEEREP